MFLALTMTAGFGAFMTASDPALRIANAEIDARKALDQYGYDWAKVHIAGGVAIITGTAPNEAERIIAYQAVRGALHQAMLDDDIVRTINSRVALADIKADPIPESIKVASAEPPPAATPDPAPAPVQEVPSAPAAAVPDPAPAPVATPSAHVVAPEPVAAAPVTNLAPASEAVAAATPAPEAPKAAEVIETSAITKPATVTATTCKLEFTETLSKSKIAFGIDSAKIEKSSDVLLDELSGIAKRCAHYKLTVEGYTDLTGRAAYNRMLSQRRADAVRTALISRGVSKEKIAAKGYGASKPVVKGENEAAYAQNRRIEIAVNELAKISTPQTNLNQAHTKK